MPTQQADQQSNRSPWRIHFFQRPSDGSVPGKDFLLACPVKVRAKMAAALTAVAEAPPLSFSGGGYWEAMHGEMSGYYEVRMDGKDRRHFRLFCILERDIDAPELGGPSIIVIAGKSKPFRTMLRKHDYEAIRELGDEYLSTRPRSVAP